MDVRAELLPAILTLVQEAAMTGEPIVRPMSYHAENCDEVTDQFFIGPDIIAAPIIERGASTRTVILPHGSWLSDQGETVTGPATIAVERALSRIPRFTRIPESSTGSN